MTRMLTKPSDDVPMSGWEDSPVAGAMVETEAGALSHVAREEAELKAAIVVARRFPRDEQGAYVKIIKSCERPSFAESARYSFPRGGQMVTGPSVDLAREMARCWGNIRYGLRIVTVDEEQIHIKGYALDLESNNFAEAEDKFAKLVFRKKGGWQKPDERDLRELVNRRGAILIRNCILQIMPPDVTDDAERRAAETMERAASGDIKQNKADAIRRLCIAFDGLGVSSAMLAEYLKHDLSLITEQELANLRGVYKSILDGNSKREDYFKVTPEQTNGSTGTDRHNAALKAKVTQRPTSEGQTFEPDPGAVESAAREEEQAAHVTGPASNYPAPQQPAPSDTDLAGTDAEPPPADDTAISEALAGDWSDARRNILSAGTSRGGYTRSRLSKALDAYTFKLGGTTGGEKMTPDARRLLYDAVCEGRLNDAGVVGGKA